MNLDDKIEDIKKELTAEIRSLIVVLEDTESRLDNSYHVDRNGIVRSSGYKIDVLAALYEELNTLRNQGYKRG